MQFLQATSGFASAPFPFPGSGGRPRQGARPQRPRARILIFLDRTRSSQARHPDFVRYAARIAVAAPVGATIEACAFGSDTRLAPFFEGRVRHLSAFARACQCALASPSSGRGTFGEPVLRRVRERLARNQEPTAVVLLTDGGFDDLQRMRQVASILARESLLLALVALPVVSANSAYTKLEEALRPLGRRARLAASADAGEALRELQECCRRGAARGRELT